MGEGEGDGSSAGTVWGRLAGGHVEHAGLVAVKVVEAVAGVVLVPPRLVGVVVGPERVYLGYVSEGSDPGMLGLLLVVERQTTTHQADEDVHFFLLVPWSPEGVGRQCAAVVSTHLVALAAGLPPVEGAAAVELLDPALLAQVGQAVVHLDGLSQGGVPVTIKLIVNIKYRYYR